MNTENKDDLQCNKRKKIHIKTEQKENKTSQKETLTTGNLKSHLRKMRRKNEFLVTLNSYLCALLF